MPSVPVLATEKIVCVYKILLKVSLFLFEYVFCMNVNKNLIFGRVLKLQKCSLIRIY